MEKKLRQAKKQMEDKTALIWKMAIASAVSWEISRLAGSEHPYLAPISVILCLQTTINQSIRFSYHRMAGTIIGILVVVFIGEKLNISGWTLGGLILIGCYTAKWLKRDESVLHQVALTVLLVFVMEHKSGGYPVDRFRDTLIGAIAAVLIQMAVKPPNFTKHALKGCREYSDHLTTILNQIAHWVESGMDKNEGGRLQTESTRLQQELSSIHKLIKDAKESLKYNPAGRNNQKELRECEEHMVGLSAGSSYISFVLEVFISWSHTGSMLPGQQALWSSQLKELIPFFDQHENPADIQPKGNVLIVTLSDEQQLNQFPLILYYQTIHLLRTFERAAESKRRN